MRTNTTLRTVLAAALFLGGIGTSARAAAPPATPASHCVVTLHAAGTPAVPMTCYATLAELAAVETDGRYTPDDEGDIVEEILALIEAAGPGETVIGVAEDVDWANETLIFKASNNVGCTTGYRYERPELGDWNDKIDSLETFGGCIATVWEHEEYTGASLLCPCSTMGVMQDEASSVKFYADAPES